VTAASVLQMESSVIAESRQTNKVKHNKTSTTTSMNHVPQKLTEQYTVLNIPCHHNKTIT